MPDLLEETSSCSIYENGLKISDFQKMLYFSFQLNFKGREQNKLGNKKVGQVKIQVKKLHVMK